MRLELIRSMITKPVYPLAEASGQGKVFLNEPADELFYFLCHFSCCAIDFYLDFADIFVRWIFKTIFPFAH